MLSRRAGRAKIQDRRSKELPAPVGPTPVGISEFPTGVPKKEAGEQSPRRKISALASAHGNWLPTWPGRNAVAVKSDAQTVGPWRSGGNGWHLRLRVGLPRA